MIYLDTSAACTLVLPELHSAALVEWLDSRPAEPVVSSVLIEVELVRAVRRVAPDRVQDARDALRFVNRVALDAEIVRRAADWPESSLRALDAIHLATALQLGIALDGEVGIVATYDERLRHAATAHHLLVASPGVD
ncbi:MAG: type II toxin-antitoxin system VapC family toxin [Candidatus Dormiibacterota bacterium]